MRQHASKSTAPAATPQRTYRYGYDSLSRLTEARYSDSEGGAGRNDTRYDYDLNGNIISLVRRGALSLSSAGPPSTYGAIDSLTLEYAGNRLRSVSDAAAGPHYQGAFHFVDGADEDEEYRYDLNGNTVTDLNRGILSSRFDTAGHPARMDFADGSSTSYLYDDAGTRLRTLHRVASVSVAVPGLQGPALTETVTDYSAGFVYEDSLLTRINLDGAYLSYTGADGSRLTTPEYHFYLRDHLGNNRVDVAADGRICQVTDYYPYGLPMASSRNAASQRWLFGGKELDRISGLDLYDFEARAYDPALARFTSPDVFEEKYPSLTPYLYCAANPLRLIDPTGNKTYLFATRLPGPLGYSIIPTHTFIYVDKSNKDNNSSQKKFQEKNYIAFGPDHPLAGGRLRRVYYEEDEESIKNMLNGDKDNRTKAVIEVPTPEGMSKEEFDNKVLEAGNSFGNNKEIEYKLNPTGECEGNCNTSSSTLLINAGVDEKGIKAIKAEIPGLDRGFSHIPKPWTKQEQSDAAKRKYKP